MKDFFRSIGKSLLVFYIIFLHFIFFLFIYERLKIYSPDTPIDAEAVKNPVDRLFSETPLPLPTFSEDFASNTLENSNNLFVPQDEHPSDVLMIPVVGVKRDQLQDTFTAERNENRVHNAIDIPAPLGTPVVAAGSGEIARFFDSEPGGITIYQFNEDKTWVFYYAHLEKRAEHIKEKDFVTRGTIIGYVGDTGNAGAGNYHLHFAIFRIESTELFWEGESINPYPLLKQGIESK